MGVENLYSDFKDAALFDYLTYLCFLLSGQKSLSNVGGWGEVHRFAVSGPNFVTQFPHLWNGGSS